MNRIYKDLSLILFLLFSIVTYPALTQTKFNADTVQSGIFDMGKMWTFDYPPVEFFKNTYNFNPDEKWFEKARLSALRFASYCSASFVSSDGLIMTNHHCARESATDVQRPNENFNEFGFYARNLTDERKVSGLYVDQLAKIEDITAIVQEKMEKDTSKNGKMTKLDKAYHEIIDEYYNKETWKGLEIQPEQFYNGGKYALYGFKRYNDIRLVFIPELNIGYFGGDYDNFTYPRYDLDCSFYRVYDQGKPLKTSDYFKFNQNGASENEPVFVIGNPGSSQRLSTISDLTFLRDVSMPISLNLLQKRSQILQAFNVKAKDDSLTNVIFIFENSIKDRKGILDGLNDPYLMARKSAFEKKFKDDIKKRAKLADQIILWDNIEKDNVQAAELYKINFLFSPNARQSGSLFAFANGLKIYALLNRTNPNLAKMLKEKLLTFKPVKYTELESDYLTAYLQELTEFLGKDDPFVQKALNGKEPKEAAHLLVTATHLNNRQVREDLLNKDTVYINNLDDPLLDLAGLSAPRYLSAFNQYKVIQERLFANRNNLGQLLFTLYGTSIPPDATFSLRINDGIVKSYVYNGTMAPSNTTFYGMYDRYYSFKQQYPWSLPKRWQNPPDQLLSIPLDFVTTNDIIGGNSGSPIINKNLELVGLAFDGNIESLPGDFIYLPDVNRCVGVTSVGIIGALKYIYKAQRLLQELTGK